MIVGYARVSTTDQSLDVQMDELMAHGCDRIFQDQATGTSRARAGLVEMMQFVRDGDTIVVSRLDRFARSLTDLFQLLDELNRKGVAFQCVHQSIDTSSSTGKLTLAILGAVAEFENDIRKERQRAGIAKAKANGVYKGRRAAIDGRKVLEMSSQGMTASEIAAEIGCHRQSVYRLTGRTRTESVGTRSK